jgi:hypothetical protein
MDKFDEYARALAENTEQAVVYEDIEEEPQKFVLSLRGAFKRAGVDATVRKMRGRNEVRAWVNEQRAASSRPTAGRGAAKGRARK